MVLDRCGFRSDVVCEAAVGSACLALDLLTQEVERDGFLVGTLRVGGDENVIAFPRCGKEAVHCAQFEQVLFDDSVEKRRCVIEKVGCLFAVFGVVEDVGVDAAEFPRVEEG